MRQEDRNVLHNMGCTPGRVALLALLLKNENTHQLGVRCTELCSHHICAATAEIGLPAYAAPFR
jgi:hypothetical protein